MNAKTDRTRTSSAALLAAAAPNTTQPATRGGVAADPVRVTVEMHPSEYDALAAFCLRAKRETGSSRKPAAAQVLRVLLHLALADTAVADRVFKELLTEGPTRRNRA